MAEFSKDAARSQWRSSKRGGHGRGRGRGPAQGQHAAAQAADGEGAAAELAQRHLEPGATGPDAGEGAEGDAPERLSQGADLQQLLADSQALYAQSYYRHRSYYQAPENIPAVDVSAVEQDLLGIDVAALAASLAHLPLCELLGVPRDHLFELEGGQEGAAGGAGTPAAAASRGSTAPSSSGRPGPQPGLGRLGAANVPLPGSQPATPSATASRQAAPPPPTPAAPAAPAAPPPADDDELDELLGLLDGPAAGGQPRAAAPAPADASPAAPPPPAASQPVRQQPTARAAAAPSSAQAGADSELDSLLALTGVTAGSAGLARPGGAAPARQPAKPPGGSKKSLEAWLDDM